MTLRICAIFWIHFCIFSTTVGNVSELTSQTIKPALTQQSNRRHIVAVTQFILITVVYVISFVPLFVFLTGIVDGYFLLYFYNFNHISNFFIYLAVNKEFRKETKILVNAIMNKA